MSVWEEFIPGKIGTTDSSYKKDLAVLLLIIIIVLEYS
jgi:hypothetical protein